MSQPGWAVQIVGRRLGMILQTVIRWKVVAVSRNREGALPDDAALTWTAEGYAGPAKTGVEPVIRDGIMLFDLSEGQGVTVALRRSGQAHFIAAIRVSDLPETSSHAGLFLCQIANGQWSRPAVLSTVRFTFDPALINAQYFPTSSWEDDVIADSGRADASGWTVVAMTLTATTLPSYRPSDGSAVQMSIDPSMAAACQVSLLQPDGAFGLVEVAGLAMLTRAPTETEIADMRAWAMAQVAG